MINLSRILFTLTCTRTQSALYYSLSLAKDRLLTSHFVVDFEQVCVCVCGGVVDISDKCGYFSVY